MKQKTKTKSLNNDLHSLSNMPFSADLISFEEITDYSIIKDFVIYLNHVSSS